MQLPLFADKEAEQIVNVAAVTHLSPFRYPGGKTWLVPRVREWLLNRHSRPKRFIEPFAGGAIVGLTVAAEGLADQVILVEIDPAVASVWNTIINEPLGGEWLAQQIENFDLTPASVHQILSATELTEREKAFQTILKNRVQRGGIMAPGAGLIKAGENGKGLLSRWYPQTLKKRILEIGLLREKIVFIHGDGLDIIKSYQNAEDSVFFVDPPYTASSKSAGNRLYTYNFIDHPSLFQQMSTVKGDFLMTYDNSEAIAEIPMKNTHHARKYELLIGRNVDLLS
jgi:DNA adenine methylase